MSLSLMGRYRPTLIFATVCILLFPRSVSRGQQPLVPGYMDYMAYAERVRKLDDLPTAVVESLGATANGREVFAVKLASTGLEVRPAVLILAGGDSGYPAGSEIAVRLAEKIAGNNDLLSSINVYVIPRANPDGLEKAIERPYRSRLGNGTMTDDDRDGRIAEDPPEDLDGDGYITQMRIYRLGGTHRADKEDPRLNVVADAAKREPGEFDLRSEGIDNDHDEQWNEDAGDGVEFNRNFAFKYPAFEHHAGPNAVSEIETRLVADFCFDHPEIQAVFVLGLHDNLVSPWKPGNEAAPRVPTSIAAEDAEYFAQISTLYRDGTKITAVPPSPPDQGSFLSWAYYHYGRWAFGSPGYAPSAPTPKPETGSPPNRPDGGSESPGQSRENNPPGALGQPAAPPGEPPPPREFPEAARRRFGGRRGRPGMGANGGGMANNPSEPPANTDQERLALRWMDENKFDGFVPWTDYVHPDFPNQKVQIGGLKPQWRANPPSGELDRITEQHANFVQELRKLFPRLEIASPKVTSLGKQLYRVEIEVSNLGYLPTSTEFGSSGRLTYPVQIEITLPPDISLLHSSQRSRERRIAGHASVKRSWIIQSTAEIPPKLSVRAGSPMTGFCQREFQLSETK